VTPLAGGSHSAIIDPRLIAPSIELKASTSAARRPATHGLKEIRGLPPSRTPYSGRAHLWIPKHGKDIIPGRNLACTHGRVTGFKSTRS